MPRRFLALLALAAAGALLAQSQAASPTDDEIRREIAKGKAYTFVFIRSGSGSSSPCTRCNVP